MAVPWAAIAQGVGNIASSFLGGALNYNYSKKLMNHQFDLQKQMLDYVNEYNSPRNQVSRLVAGGMNPNLAYSSVNSVAGSSTPSVSGGSSKLFDMPRLDIGQGLLLGEQIRTQKAEASLTEQRAEGERLENERKRAEQPYWESSASYRNDTLKWLNMSSEFKGKSDEINYQLNSIIRDAKTGGTHSYPQLDIDDSRDTPLYRATVDRLTREGLTNDEIDSRIQLYNKRLNEISARIDLMRKQGINIDMRTELLSLEKEMKETLGVSYSDNLGWRLLSRFLGGYGVTPEKLSDIINADDAAGSLLGLPYWLYKLYMSRRN